MIVVMVRIPVGSEEEGRKMVERFRNRAGLVDSQPGFVGFELLMGDSELISTTRWATREDLERWMSSDANAQAHGQAPRPTGGGHPQGEGEIKTAHAHAHSPAEAQQTGTAQAPRGNPQGSVMVYEIVIPEGGQS